MNLNQLNENIKQYDINNLIQQLRRDYYFFIKNGLRGPEVFESGKCFEFSLGLYNHLIKRGETPEIIFLIGNMKKSEAVWDENKDVFDPTEQHPFHTIIKVRKFYYDINGKLGNKRDITAMWHKFRNKVLLKVTPDQTIEHAHDKNLIIELENQLNAYSKN